MKPQNRGSESLVCRRTCSRDLMQSLIEARKGFYLNAVYWEQRDRLEGTLQNKENIIGRKRRLNAFSCAPSIVADSLLCIIKSIFAFCGEGVIFFDCRHAVMESDRTVHQTEVLWHWRTHAKRGMQTCHRAGALGMNPRWHKGLLRGTPFCPLRKTRVWFRHSKTRVRWKSAWERGDERHSYKSRSINNRKTVWLMQFGTLCGLQICIKDF